MVKLSLVKAMSRVLGGSLRIKKKLVGSNETMPKSCGSSPRPQDSKSQGNDLIEVSKRECLIHHASMEKNEQNEEILSGNNRLKKKGIYI